MVAATISPVHSLVSMVTEGVSKPALIIRPGASPHHYSLKPSEARALDQADLIFWIGDVLEPWMAKTIRTLGTGAAVVELGAVEGLTKLPVRDGGIWDQHGEHDHGYDGNESDEGHQHDDVLIDPHLWLDPLNAIIWLDVIAVELAAIDAENASTYYANARSAQSKLREIMSDIQKELEAVQGTPYIVFHDAYHYFERRFSLNAVGAISLSDADRPSAARLQKLRQRIEGSGADCAFTEPQFQPKLLDTVIANTDLRKGVLDPIGVGLEPGPALYPSLLTGLAMALLDCLSGV